MTAHAKVVDLLGSLLALDFFGHGEGCERAEKTEGSDSLDFGRRRWDATKVPDAISVCRVDREIDGAVLVELGRDTTGEYEWKGQKPPELFHRCRHAAIIP